MKHWDPIAASDASPLGTSRWLAFDGELVRAQRRESRIGSVVGLVLAAGVLVGLALLLQPPDLVAPDLLH